MDFERGSVLVHDGPDTPMKRLLDAALLVLGLVAALLAVAVAWEAIEDGPSALRTVAKLCFASLLAGLAWLAFRRPRAAADRARRRVLKLVAVLASTDLQREWAESTPSTDLAEALLSDWREAVRDDVELGAAFDEDERVIVMELRADLETLAGRLPAGPGAASSGAWAAVCARARTAHDAMARRLALGAGSPPDMG